MLIMKNNKFMKKSLSYEKDLRQEAGGIPSREGVIKDFISKKSLKALPNSSVSFTADPYTSALPGSQPYPILMPFNRPISGSFAGDRNLDGGIASQMSTSVTSKFYNNVFDTMAFRVDLNYKYVDWTRHDGVGKGIINKMLTSIDETVSALSATTFTAMAIYDYAIETDMNMGSAEASSITPTVSGNENVKVYTNISSVLLGSSIMYQMMIQCLLLANNIHNSFRTKMGEMMRMEYDRRQARLNSYFGLIKKKSYLALPYSLAVNMPGEFIDLNWMQQVNTLLLTPGRRSESLNDCLIEMIGTYKMPTVFKLHVVNKEKTTLTGTVFDYNSLNASINGESKSLSSIVSYLSVLLSAQDTLTWARNASIFDDGKERFNIICDIWNALVSASDTIKTGFSDLRTVFNTLSRVNVNNWVTGFEPGIIKDTDMTIHRNLLLENIIKNVMTGPDSITLDPKTMYWQSTVLWDIYLGIPEYAAYSGGAFLSFSLKDLSNLSDSVAAYIPLCFSLQNDTPVFMTSRDGTQVKIGFEEKVVGDDPVLSRLAILPIQEEYILRVPKLPTLEIDGVTNLEMDDETMLRKTLEQLFGYYADDDKSFIDTDLLCLYDYQIADFTNNMIAYARSESPFRTSVTESTFGFVGTK